MSKTIGKVVSELSDRFSAAGIETSRLDARILVARAVSIEPSLVFARSDQEMDPEARHAVEIWAARRLGREPLSRILGKREFWGLNFGLSADTLDPRPDTETVVEAVLDLKPRLQGRPVQILDLGTGTGCILLAILSDWSAATGLGIDLSEGAVRTARQNASDLCFEDRAWFRVGMWAKELDGTFDVVVSNPPYIAESEREFLPDEVAKFDPSLALFAGVDGLDAYRELIPSAKQVLKPDGYLVLEVGITQCQAVADLISSHGFGPVSVRKDLSGADRCLVAQAA